MPSTEKSTPSAIPPSLPADGPAAAHFAPAFQAAIRELQKAYELAIHSGYDPWDLAVEIGQLRTIGITETDLRWLVRSGYVDHAREVTEPEEDGREFRCTGNLSFAERTCVVLTASGDLFAQTLFNDGAHERIPPPKGIDQTTAAATGTVPAGSSANGDAGPAGTRDLAEHPNGSENGGTNRLVPTWDSQRHELRVGGQLVKRFKSPAANQEAILAVFEEEGWPPRIDDPLPPQAEQDSKRRLNDTIKCLNKNQTHKLICFHGDGTGEGVLWSFADCDEADSSCPHKECLRHATVPTPHGAQYAPPADDSPRNP